MGKILLEGLEFYAYHGHFAEEQKIGGNFRVHVELEVSFEKACSSDNLEDTVDYQKIYDCIYAEMAIPSALLEHLTNRIAEKIIDISVQIRWVNVKVSKINPPFGGKVNAVTIEVRKENKR